MLEEKSITTPAPPTTEPEPTVFELIKTAYNQTIIAARIAQGIDDLEDITFDDLDQIARNCVNAHSTLKSIQQRLAESEVAAS